MVKHMEYFKRIQCYKPTTGVIDSPVRIEEIALLQDSVDKNILGRVKFINQSQKNIIAIFVNMVAQNIAGESITLESKRYIYQDMLISSGELYGNKIPIALPDDTRKFQVSLDKVVFEDGSIWNVDPANVCEVIPQEEISVPKECLEKYREKLSEKINNLEYVKYYYEEGTNFWECSCGKIHNYDEVSCDFCSLNRHTQKSILTKDAVYQSVLEITIQLENEKEEQAKIRQKEQEEREKQKQIQNQLRDIEYEKKKRAWYEEEKRYEEKIKREEENRVKKQKNIMILLVVAILVSAIGVATYFAISKGNEEKVTDSQILGLENELSFYPGAYYSFQVIGAGTDNTDPKVGDIKWEPLYWCLYSDPQDHIKHTTWRIGTENGVFEENIFNIYIFFRKFRFNGSYWEETDNIESLTVPIKCGALNGESKESDADVEVNSNVNMVK